MYWFPSRIHYFWDDRWSHVFCGRTHYHLWAQTSIGMTDILDSDIYISSLPRAWPSRPHAWSMGIHAKRCTSHRRCYHLWPQFIYRFLGWCLVENISRYNRNQCVSKSFAGNSAINSFRSVCRTLHCFAIIPTREGATQGWCSDCLQEIWMDTNFDRMV